MVHLYTSKKYNDEEFKVFCTGEWVVDTERAVALVGKWGSTYRPKHFTSVHHNVTCPACLDILIPKKERELAKMVEARNQSKKETACPQS